MIASADNPSGNLACVSGANEPVLLTSWHIGGGGAVVALFSPSLFPGLLFQSNNSVASQATVFENEV